MRMSMARAHGYAEEVRAWFKQYDAIFAALASGDQNNVEALLNFYSIPVTMTTDDVYRVLSDGPSILQYLNSAIRLLRRSGYAQTVTHRFDVRILNRRSAIIDVDVSRLSTGGSELARFGAVEVASRTDDGWRISAVLVTPFSRTAGGESSQKCRY